MTEKLWHTRRWPAGVEKELVFPEVSLVQLIEDAAREYGGRCYTLFQGASMSYREIDARSNQLAHFLMSKGIGKGDRAAIFMPNIPQYPLVYFGILKCGAVCVTCNPLYKDRELAHQLRDSGAKVLFVMDHPMFYDTARRAMQGSDVELLVYCNIRPYLPTLKGLVGGLLGKIPAAQRHDPHDFALERALASRSREPPRVPIRPGEDLALILYTGGTTGVSKGACLTHSNIYSNLCAADEFIRVVHAPGEAPCRPKRGGKHTLLAVLPFYHSYGHTHIMLYAAFIGARVVCIPDPRAGNPPFTEILRLTEAHSATMLHGVPTLFTALLAHPDIARYSLKSLVACSSAAASMPMEVARRFEELTGATIYEAYGLTETGPLALANPTNRETRKVGSVGVPIPGTDIKIVDVESGTRELALGEDGEIALSGPQVMSGYWNRPEENELVFRDFDGKRFFLTGDIGHLDEDGFTFITDRKKDMIDVGGLKAYPKEIEEVLYSHPKIANAAVIGVPDERSIQAVKAFVQLNEGESATEAEIIDFCRDKMAGYKRPREVEFRDQLPTSPVGKILRRVLRDEELAKRKG